MIGRRTRGSNLRPSYHTLRRYTRFKTTTRLMLKSATLQEMKERPTEVHDADAGQNLLVYPAGCRAACTQYSV